MEPKVIDRFTQQVEGLLEVESPTLFKHLLKILGTKADVYFRNIIQHLMQRMFVGMLNLIL